MVGFRLPAQIVFLLVTLTYLPFSVYSWNEFAKHDVIARNFVITVCDHATNQACHLWPGQPIEVPVMIALINMVFFLRKRFYAVR